MAEPTCAVWYVSHQSLYYQLCDDEDAAVKFAIWMFDDGDGAPLGVQFADGRALKYDEWAAAQAERQRQIRAAIKALDERPRPKPRPVRHVKSPLPWAYPDETIEVDATEPSWLGFSTAFPDNRQNDG